MLLPNLADILDYSLYSCFYGCKGDFRLIQKIKKEDKKEFFTLLDEFYHSSAVLHPVPKSHYESIYNELISQSPYAVAYFIKEGEQIAGFAQLSFTFSTEAGGMVLWVEELYIRPQFRGKGLGSAFFQFLEEEYGKSMARFRLEIEPDNERAKKLYKRMGFKTLGYLQMIKDREED